METPLAENKCGSWCEYVVTPNETTCRRLGKLRAKQIAALSWVRRPSMPIGAK
jgi:hypothetical protein